MGSITDNAHDEQQERTREAALAKAAAPTEQPKNPNQAEVDLDTPVVRGQQKIEKLIIRKPISGELRGVTLMDLMQMDVLALRKVLPRITVPPLTDVEVGNLDPADLVACGVEVAGFLLQKKAKAGYLDV